MQNTPTELIMLGTGYATAIRCYNTCFALRNETAFFLVDAGGGNGILNRLEQARIPLASVREVFVTHAHTDHILGVIWVIRMWAQMLNKGKCTGPFTIYGHDQVLEVLDWVCRRTLPAKIAAQLDRPQGIRLCELRDGDAFRAAGMEGHCFDIGSTKAKQFGFRLTLPDGKKLACLGDEPYNERNRADVESADWLMCEAFCLYADREQFKPYEKHHSSALDAGRLAAQLGISNLLLYHTEDTALATRRAQYTAEAATEFGGAIYVPDDLERIIL